jgi:hypothetical protein
MENFFSEKVIFLGYALKNNLKKKVVFRSGRLFSKKDILKMSKNQKGLLKRRRFFRKIGFPWRWSENQAIRKMFVSIRILQNFL